MLARRASLPRHGRAGTVPPRTAPRLRARTAVPAIQALTQASETGRLAELAWLAKRLPAMSGRELALVEQMSRRLVASSP